ncbi:MAG: hypothetical protein J6K25_15820 [Thermoguttaceae bacterium]|nr:hypothetical protein [Thermoguttaceae bacterium]MBP3532623.1 hypothetical protein [Thermoguttaceae bacterium]
MKIEIFAKTGKIEVDNVNALIALVESSIVEKTTIIEAGGKKAEAQKFRELKEVFEKLETAAAPEPSKPEEKAGKGKEPRPARFTIVAALIVVAVFALGAEAFFSGAKKAVVNRAIEKEVAKIFLDNGNLSLGYYKQTWDKILPEEPPHVVAVLSDCPSAQLIWSMPSGKCTRLAEEMFVTFNQFDGEDRGLFLEGLKNNVEEELKNENKEGVKEYLETVNTRLQNISELIRKRDATTFLDLFFGVVLVSAIAAIVVVLVARTPKRKSAP